MTQRVTATYSNLSAAREAVHDLVEHHINPRRISVRADLGGTSERLKVRFVPRDRLGAVLGFGLGAAAVAFLDVLYEQGLWLPAALSDLLATTLGAPVLMVAAGLLGMMIGVLWGLGRERLRVEDPSRRPQRIHVAVRGPHREIAREIFDESDADRLRVA